MPSTYTLNNGIELIATGEQSGTWGDTTNTNFELLDTSLDGQVTVTLASTGSSGSPNTLPVSDGAASNGRNRLVIFDDSSDLGGTAFVQLTPSDAEKIIYVRNSLSGSRSILLFQGTYNASNDYEVPAGTTAVVFFNGAGAGAVAANVFNNAHFDNLNVVGAVEIGGDLTVDTTTLHVDSTNNRVGVGTITPDYLMQIEASDPVLSLYSSGSNRNTHIYMGDSTDADAGRFSYDIANDQLQIWTNGAKSMTINSDATTTIINDNSGTGGANLHLFHDTASAADGDYAGDLVFYSNSDAGNKRVFSRIRGYAEDVTDTSEDAILFFFNRMAGVERESLRLTSTVNQFNGANQDVDFKVSTQNQANTLFVDAGRDRIYIGKNTSDNLGTNSVTIGGSLGSSWGASLGFENDATGGVNGFILATDDTWGIGNGFGMGFGAAGSDNFRLFMSSTEVVFNERNQDIDFRVESVNYPHMFYVDAGSDTVTIGGSDVGTHAGMFNVAGDLSVITGSGNPKITIKTGGTGNNPGINYRAGDNIVFDNMLVASAATDYWRVGFGTSGSVTSEVLTVNTNSRVGIQTTEPDAELHIAGSHPHIDLGPKGGNRAKLGFRYDNLYLGMTAGGGEVILKNNVGSTDEPSASGDEIARFGDDVVINNNARDQDFKVKSDNEANMFFLEAGNDRIFIAGVADSYDANKLNIRGASVVPGTTNGNVGIYSTDNHQADVGGSLTFGGRYTSSGTYYMFGGIQAVKRTATSGDASGKMKLYYVNNSNGTIPYHIASQDGIQFNPDGNNVDFTVASDNNSNMLVVDAGANQVVVGSAATVSNHALRVAGSVGGFGGDVATTTSGASRTLDIPISDLGGGRGTYMASYFSYGNGGAQQNGFMCMVNVMTSPDRASGEVITTRYATVTAITYSGSNVRITFTADGSYSHEGGKISLLKLA